MALSTVCCISPASCNTCHGPLRSTPHLLSRYLCHTDCLIGSNCGLCVPPTPLCRGAIPSRQLKPMEHGGISLPDGGCMRNPETELPVNSQLVSSESSMDYLQPFPIQGCIPVGCIQLFPTVGGMLFTTFSNPGWELDFPPKTTF